MNIQILSDLHLEFYPDRGLSFIEALDSSGIDVLIVAGDLTTIGAGTGNGLIYSLTALAAKFPNVIYVAGNHEFWGAHSSDITAIKFALKHVQNLHWLERETVTIDDQRFVGATLWFKEAPAAHRYRTNDFSKIRDFTPWVYLECGAAVSFLSKHVEPTDVVVTHYLPSYRSVSERYLGDPGNAFFVCDLEELILNRQPKLWVHGHTHDSKDYMIGKTRVVCNPYGYKNYETNRDFINKKIVIL